MKTFSVICALPLLSLSLSTQTAWGQKTQELKVSSVDEAIEQICQVQPLKKEDRSGLYLVPTLLNQEKCHMIIDSGANTIVLNEVIGKKAGIKMDAANPLTAKAADGTDNAVKQGMVTSFKIGAAAVNNQKFAFLDMSPMGDLSMEGEKHPRGGQLGHAYLKAASAVVDYGKDRLLIPKSKIAGGLASVYAQAGYPVLDLVEEKNSLYVKANLMGKEVMLKVDTGANAMTLREDYAKELGLTITTKDMETTMIGKKNSKSKVAQVKEVNIGPVKLPDVPFLLIEDTRPMEKVQDLPMVGLLGNNFLKPSQAIIDFAASKMAIGIAKKKKQ